MTRPRPLRPSRVERLELRQLLAAGALDTAFSGDGIATANPSGATFIAEDVCLQPDGKTVVVGNANGARVARYNVDGTLDTSFGFNGFAQLPVLEVGRAVAMQGTSIIVVGDADGGEDGTHPAVARLTSGGSLDSAFGAGGSRVVDVPGENSHANDVVVQRDSKIVLAGSSNIGEGAISIGDHDFIAVRFTGNGAVDTPFGGGDGVTEVDFTEGEDEAFCVALDYTAPASDPRYGSIFLAGHRQDDTQTASIVPDSSRFAVARLTPAGLRDGSFDGNGLLTTEFPNELFATAYDAVVQPSGKLVVTGVVQVSDLSTQRNFMTIRYQANGAIDSTFGPATNGYVETNLGGNDTATGIAINYDGGLIVSGQSSQRMALVAYTADGDIDTRFGGGDGIQTYGQTTVTSIPLDPTFNHREPGTKVKVVATGSTINPIRRILAAGGANTQVIRVVDVAPTVTLSAADAVSSEGPNNSASFFITLSHPHPEPLRVRFSVSGTAIAPDDDRGTNDQDYNVTGVGFGNQFQTAYVDIPAGVTVKAFILAPVDDAIVEADESVVFSLVSNAAYDVGSPSVASMIIRDNEPRPAPSVVSNAFLDETLPLQATFTFSQDVNASLSIADFIFSAGLPTPTFAYNSSLNTATLTWAAALPDGTYSVRAKASGITNAAGTHLTADSVKTFGVLAGDANHDGTVGFADLVILAQHYNQTGNTFSTGNFNYSTDGNVDFADLVILAQQYNKSLALSSRLAVPASFGSATRRPRLIEELL